MVTRAFLLIAFLVGAAAGAQAQSYDPAKWAEIVAAAKKEGSVNFYTGVSPNGANLLVEGFKKAYPDIKIFMVRNTGAALTAKVEQERVSGADGADVVMNSERAWFDTRQQEGQLLKAQGPSLKDWPAKALIGGTEALNGIEVFAIGYNTALTKNPPKTYQDLLKPEYKNNLGAAPLISTVHIGLYKWIEGVYGDDYLVKLKAQNPKLYPGSSPASQALASGEVAVTLYNTPNDILNLKAQGAPVEFVIPSPAFGYEYIASAVGWSKRPNAALVLLDYLMSKDSQVTWHGFGSTASPMPNIPGALPIQSVTLWKPSDYTPETNQKFRDHWDEIFKAK